MNVCAVFHSLPLRPDDPLHLIVNISLYLSCRFDIQNASGNGDIPLQGYCRTLTRLCSATQGTVIYPPQGLMLLAIHEPVLWLGEYAFFIFALPFSNVLSTVPLLSLPAFTSWRTNRPLLIQDSKYSAKPIPLSL